MFDGTVRRLPLNQCEAFLETKQARRFISNTIYRAMKLGIEVRDFNTRDDDGSLKKRIREASEKKTAAAHKAEQKKKKKEEEASKHREAQTVLNED